MLKLLKKLKRSDKMKCISILDYMNEWGRIVEVETDNVSPEPNINPDFLKRYTYVKLDDLAVDSVLDVRPDKSAHPHASYLIKMINTPSGRRVKLWNRGRGDHCFVCPLEAISYFERKTMEAEFRALKVGGTSIWPYFQISSDNRLVDPSETWMDHVGEILLFSP